MASLVAMRSGRRGPLFGLYFAVLLAAASVASLEAVLRIFPGVLTGQTANYAYSGYHDHSGGIYRCDRHMGLAMRPNLRREIYWNGHWWLHEANAAGYRGPQVHRAAAVFLGDSMIYGHGVANDDTVSSCFRARTGLEVANLGQQGTCAIQYWLRLRDVGLSLSPCVVFVCCHPNDIDEPCYFYSADELRRFLERPIDDGQPPTVLEKFLPRPWWSLEEIWNEYLAIPLRVTGAMNGLKLKASDPSGTRTSPAAPALGYASVAGMIDAHFAPWEATASEEARLGWQAHVRSLEKIAWCCRRQGATMILFDIGVPREFSKAMESLAHQLGVRYSSAGRIALDRALAGADIYLANDGHWSAHGCDVIAAELAKEMHAIDSSNHGSAVTLLDPKDPK
jgi:hypothetical protein